MMVADLAINELQPELAQIRSQRLRRGRHKMTRCNGRIVLRRRILQQPSNSARHPPSKLRRSSIGKRRKGGSRRRQRLEECASSNENKMSDGWRDGTSLRIEGGISWKIRIQSCQPFAPSLG